MSILEGKTLFITGARGIGFEIGLMAARQGANVVIAAKTIEPNQYSSQTIYSAAEAIEREGGQALPIQMDIRYEDNIINAIDMAVEAFGGLDYCINSASAIQLSSLENIDIKRYDLMQQINVRGSLICAKYARRFLLKSDNPHIVTITPPLNLDANSFKAHLPYTLSKYATSLSVLGLAEMLRDDGIAVNGLWHRSSIVASEVHPEEANELTRKSRYSQIMADATKCILEKKSSEFTGNFCIDEDLLRDSGINDFSKYAVDEDEALQMDVFVEEMEAI